MFIDFQLIVQSLPTLLQGVLVSMQIAFFGCTIGLFLGTILAFMHTSTITIMRFIVGTYVTIIRGTPMLIQILFAYYVLPQLLGMRLEAITLAIIAIGLNSAAYISQVIKSGITSVSIGQIEAAHVLGFSKMHIARYIVLPQALRVVLPALGNELTTLIKDSSLASIIGVAELSKQGRLVIQQTYDALSVYCAVAFLYLLMTSTVSLFITYLEKRMDHHAQD